MKTIISIAAVAAAVFLIQSCAVGIDFFRVVGGH